VSTANISTRVLEWFERHGRTDLPWQVNPTPYRVWVSEIMLQQTQVATVIPYYERFMARFPDVLALAGADQDQVLHHWSGLGYYARARNLHAAAQVIRDRHEGRFPEDLEALLALPGIGRSSAGAILALAAGQRHPILDGNVKRVLARYHAFEGWPGQAAMQRTLWTLAEQHTPYKQVAAYTQAMMDLGATVCTRTSPSCGLCPLQVNCRARASGRQGDYPSPRPRKPLPLRKTRMLLLRNAAGEVLLERRPPAGIWGGLWSFPELAPDEVQESGCLERLGCHVQLVDEWGAIRHTFSHFRLQITPVLAIIDEHPDAVMEGGDRLWYKPDSPDELGFAAPVERLLQRINELQ
jgi:A/G-specific adenine glycosylase